MDKKRTVIYKEIDGHKIIIGFDRPHIDPEATKIAIATLVPKTEEHKALEAKKSEYNQAYRAMLAARSSKNEGAYKAAIETMEALQPELMGLAKALDDKIKAMRLENAVYFEPKSGEAVVDASEALALSEALKQATAGVFVDIQGQPIRDQRGTVYFSRVSGKWQRAKVARLGGTVPSGAVLASDVTESQAEEIERDRISGLSAIQKAEEREKALVKAMADSVSMRSQLEIKGDAEALVKSKKHYEEVSARIEALYA